MFICIFPAWLIGTCNFCLSCSGFMGDKFFSLFLTLFAGLICDLYNGCLVGDFEPLGVVRAGVIRVLLFGIQHCISPLSQPVTVLVLGKIRPSVVFAGALETLAKHSLPTGSIFPRVFFICFLDWCIHLPCNRDVVVFSHVGPNNFPSFSEGHIPLVFHLKFFRVFFCKHHKIWRLDDLVCILHI